MGITITDAIHALIALLDNCTLADEDDFVNHAYYSTVAFVPEYPLATEDVPTVAFSLAGGTNRRTGLGKCERWHGTRLQLDVLAENPLYARRIYEKVREVVLYDMDDGAGASDGTCGSLYLYNAGVKDVEIGEAIPQVWDTDDAEHRIARLVADVYVTFED